MEKIEQPYAARTAKKMKDVLLYPDSPSPEIHYYMIRGGENKRNITIWETGTVGGEYVKTYGHYHVIDFKETYSFIAGEGILLLQIRKKDALGAWIDDEIETFRAIRVKAGDSIAIPSFCGHAVVNTGKTWLVTSDDSPVDFSIGSKDSVSMPQHADYEAIKKTRGLAYYVIEKDGQPILVKNPAYKNVPEAKIEDSF